jgi:hypothetical protein
MSGVAQRLLCTAQSSYLLSLTGLSSHAQSAFAKVSHARLTFAVPANGYIETLRCRLVGLRIELPNRADPKSAWKLQTSTYTVNSMKWLTAVLLSYPVLFAPQIASAQVTSNVFERVLKLRVNAGTRQEETATAFTIDVDGREYLLTAKHVTRNLKDEDKVDIFMNETWAPLQVKVFRCEDPIDIAVLVPPHQLTVNFDLPFENTRFTYGQEAYFLGFPYGIQSTGRGVNGPYPLAIIKRGAISGVVSIDQNKKATMILLDGYNNPGFSGGPIVYRDLNQSGYAMNVVAVVSGFIPEVVPVMKEHDIQSPANAGDAAKAQPWKIRKRDNGTYFEYIENGTFVALNTGIVQGYAIEPAIDLIRKHPIGPEAKDLPGNQPKTN